jgi:hypothetical protein
MQSSLTARYINTRFGVQQRCSGCCVARFCSEDHQKMASKKAALDGSLRTGLHKDICGILSRWREVVKDGVAPDSADGAAKGYLRNTQQVARGCEVVKDGVAADSSTVDLVAFQQR